MFSGIPCSYCVSWIHNINIHALHTPTYSLKTLPNKNINSDKKHTCIVKYIKGDVQSSQIRTYNSCIILTFIVLNLFVHFFNQCWARPCNLFMFHAFEKNKWFLIFI